MNITDLTLDAKYVLAQQLSGEELVRLCSTNTNMRKICTTSKFNPIWIDKLKKEYNIDYTGTNAYTEYLYSTRFYKETYWVATYSVRNNIKTKLFINREDAINNIANYIFATSAELGIDMTFSYPAIKNQLIRSGRTSFGMFDLNIEISLTESKFVLSQHNYEEKYQERLRELSAMIYPNDKNQQDEFIEEFLLEIENIDTDENYEIDIKPKIKSLMSAHSIYVTPEIDKFLNRLFNDPEFLE